MSDESDCSLARHDSQAKSGDKLTSVNSDDPLYQAQLRYFTAFAAIGELIFAFISGEVFGKLATRFALLAKAAFIPESGSGNDAATAFLMGMTPSGVYQQARRNNVPTVRPGEESIYRFSDLTKKWDPPAAENQAKTTHGRCAKKTGSDSARRKPKK